VQPQHTNLALSGLTKTYGTTIAVDNVTLRIAAGEMVALLGPSGCGKTTTLRMIAGLIQPTAGEILIGSERITRLPASFLTWSAWHPLTF
jgi:putative spermidine/putrescine transport system ATP-binding protein